MKGLNEIIDSLEVKFFKLNQKLIQLEKKNSELEALLQKTIQENGVKQSEIQKINLPNDGGLIEIIAGNYQGSAGSVSTFTPIEMYNARLNKGGKAVFSFPENYNTGFVF